MNLYKKSNEKEKEDIDEAANYLLRQIKAFPKHIDGKIWVSALMFIVVLSHKNSKIPYEQMTQWIDIAMEFYEKSYKKGMI